MLADGFKNQWRFHRYLPVRIVFWDNNLHDKKKTKNRISSLLEQSGVYSIIVTLSPTRPPPFKISENECVPNVGKNLLLSN